MSRPDLTALAESERTDLLALLRTLSPSQWAAASLCTAWSVRDVAAHVVSYDELSPTSLVGMFFRGGGSIETVNDMALRRCESLDATGVTALVARNLRPRGLTAAFGGGTALIDGTIHHQDIRRALGLPRVIPGERLRHVLDAALRAPTLPARRNARGLRLSATDVEWRRGVGEEVSGPGEALLMALAGRPHALSDLAGPGVAMLRARIGG